MSVSNVLRETALANVSEAPEDIKKSRYARRVLLEANNAVPQGYGVCYERTTGTASEEDPLRSYLVALPSTSNNLAFAGVAAKSYSSSAQRQWIEIWEPGAVCLIHNAGGGLTINQADYLTCILSQDTTAPGTFKKEFRGFQGRGSARVMETTSAAGLFLGELLTGPESGCFEWLPVEYLGGTPAFTMTTHGVSLFELTPGNAMLENATNTMADGTFTGQKKLLWCKDTHITYDVVVTITNGVQMDGTTALNTLSFDGAGDYALLEWHVSHWKLMDYVGVALA